MDSVGAAFASPRVRGAVVLGLGLWLLPLTWMLYIKYERERKHEPGPEVPLIVFLVCSAVLLVGAAWWRFGRRHATNYSPMPDLA